MRENYQANPKAKKTFEKSPRLRRRIEQSRTTRMNKSNELEIEFSPEVARVKDVVLKKAISQRIQPIHIGHTLSAIDLNCETDIWPRSLRDFEPGAIKRSITARRPASQIS